MKAPDTGLSERVAGFISRHNMFAPGMPVGVAVSGGADSVCLLHVLAELAPRWALKLRVLHLDHRLRGEESREDAGFVAGLAARLGLPFELRELDVGLAADNLEQAARRARRDFFLEAISAGRVQRVALGHTRDDQAETVLYRFLRGSGTAGLAGMRPVTREGLVRPLLGATRAEVEEYLRSKGIGWREDSSNRDLRFRRNRIRHQLLPALAGEWNPALGETLAGVARVAADEEEYWRGEVDRLAGEVFTYSPPEVVMDGGRLGALAPAVARRLIRRAIETVKGDLRSIDVRHVEAILGLSGRAGGHGRVQAPGVDVMRSFQWLRLTPAGSRSRPEFAIAISAPGRYAFPGGEVEISGEIGAPLELRNWRPGDAYRPAGASRARKIKEMFQDARIPLWRRGAWPVLTADGRIVWAAEFGPGFSETGRLLISSQ
ncbi:MAG: tRNA lysidine(34) synthetase TilS [Bryobacterales bacterium]|nr:tRNA lysidine(34) synthetase TilS [Bryobacterales bacterium]